MLTIVFGLTGAFSTGVVLAQTPAPDAATLMNVGRFDDAKQRLRRNTEQSPSMQTYFDTIG